MYEEKKDAYFKNIRKELLDLIPQENRNGKMLEIGAGSGDTLVYAKQNNYAKEIYGVELCKIPNSFQSSTHFEKFIIANVEEIDLPFDNEMFDVIICADVLEHLVNPYEQIYKLKKILKNDGVIVASLPNIRQIQIIKQIFINGDFRYTDAGILDKTHLRFFCKKNMVELFENADLKVKRIISNSNLIGKTTKLINKLTFNLFDEFLAAQYYLVVSKK
jgi:2-polyprenyl-3-methyl-5-hydroxy-6-metoxy-1,4-benzoquinol methylase